MTNQIGTTITPGMGMLTVDDLARMLKVSKRTIWRMRSSGKLPQPVTIGGGVRWRADFIQEWIEKGCPAASLGDNNSKR